MSTAPDEDRRSFSLLDASDMEKFLAASGAVGEHDGAGEFTLNLKQAMQNLEKFTLAEPGFYVRYLVASAIARGATRIELKTAVQTLLVEDDGASFSFDQLRSALPSILNSQTSENAGRRYLAVGLCGARALGFRRASVSCPGGCLLLQNNQLELSPQGSGEGTRIEITERRSLAGFAGKLLKRRSLWEHVETALQTFRYTTADLSLNGQTVGFRHPVFKGPYFRIGKDGEKSGEDLAVVRSSLPLSGYISLSAASEGPLSFILHGICFESQAGAICALVYCDELRLNASFQGLVQNEMFQALIREIASKRILVGLDLISSPEADPQIFEMVAQVLRSLRGRMPEDIQRALEESTIAGKPYRRLREVYERAGYLPLTPEMEVAEAVLLELFPSCIRLSTVEVPESREVLCRKSGAVYAPLERPYVLRFDISLMEHPCPCLPGRESLPFGEEICPFGFQLVWTELYTPQNDFLFQFDEFRDFGLCVHRAVQSGLFSLSRVRPFFLNLLEWLLDVGGELAKKQSVRCCLVLEREDGELLTYWTAMTLGSTPYILEGEPPIGIPHALRLNERELRLLGDFGEVVLVYAGART